MKRRNIVKLCFEFNDFLYSEHFKYLEIAHSSIYNICKSLYLYLRIIVRDVLKNRFKIKSLSYYYKLYSNQNVFFSPTLNNRRAVDDIERLVHNSYHITNIFDSRQYPIFQVYIYSSLYAFSVIRKFLSMKSGVRKNITGNALLNYILAAGFYIVSCKICKYSRIQSLIVSNDHTYFTRAFIKSAQQYHVDSLYAQHASVAEYYPQLS